MSVSRHERVSADQDGQRVDNFLIRHCTGVPRSHIYQLIRKGSVLVDGKRVKQTRKLVAGEQVRIPAMSMAPAANVTVPSKLADAIGKSVVYETADFYVLNKPAGVAVHGGSGLAFGLIDAIRQYSGERNLELAHRLDRATSGALLVGRGMPATRRLQDLFRHKQIEKQYLALVDGHWPDTLDLVDVPLLKNAEQAGERRVIVSHKGQQALTHFNVAKRYKQATLLNVRLETGRTHQIRVHTKHSGHAVVGDGRYGDNKRNAMFRKSGLARLFLHARLLSFIWNNETVQVTCEPDEAWRKALSGLRHSL